jgi:hypothetical protein
MCRNIKTLFNFDPPATDDEIRAAALQFVRKIAGTRTPSKKNVKAFEIAVEEIFHSSRRLMDTMEPFGAPKNREEEAMKAKAKSQMRFRKVGT